MVYGEYKPLCIHLVSSNIIIAVVCLISIILLIFNRPTLNNSLGPNYCSKVNFSLSVVEVYTMVASLPRSEE